VNLRMNHFLHGTARAAAEAFDLAGPILEIGSYQVAGQEAIADLRGLFPGQPYIGVDMRQGPGVDCVASVDELPYPDASIGAVVAMSTFEHVACFWRGFEEVRRVLRRDGVLLVSCPFYFHIHSYPSDYWRFTPEALDVLLAADYPTRILGWHGPRNRPLNVWALAFGDQYPPVTAAQYARYQQLLARYAHEPVHWFKQCRYQLARLICGRGPVAPYLEQDRWGTVCRTRQCNPSRQSAAANSTLDRKSPSALPAGIASSCCADA